MMTQIVIQQMVIIFLLIVVGMVIFKLGHLTENSTKDLSWIVVNITNPITMLVAALEDEEKISTGTIGIAFLAFAGAYLFLGLVGYVLPLILRVKREERYAYRYLSVFANVGFIGIPFCSAVLGVHSLIYVTICCLVFNIIAYTIGMSAMRRISIAQHPDKAADIKQKLSVTDLINTGTVMSVVTILIYVLDIKLPVVMESTFSLMGRCTTFLSMLVLGVSVAQVSLKEIFSGTRFYLFTVIRQILVPIILLFVLRMVLPDELMIHTIVLLTAMPCANMPLMMAKQFEVDDYAISKGIIMTTVLSVVTIPLVAMML